MPTTGTFQLLAGFIATNSGVNYHISPATGYHVYGTPSNDDILFCVNVSMGNASGAYGTDYDFAHAGSYGGQVTWVPDQFTIFLDGATADHPTDQIDLPPGFAVTSAWLEGSARGGFLASDPTVETAHTQFIIGALLGPVEEADQFLHTFAFPGPVTLNGILATPVGIKWTAETHGTINGGPRLKGTYEIQLSWWKLPETCDHPSELRYDAAPGLPYTAYDPDDVAAHPTPSILNIMPSHGSSSGGTPITIRGSGFGIGATVTFDGVEALDIDTTDANTIICTTPAHAAGSVAVVITNADGVAST